VSYNSSLDAAENVTTIERQYTTVLRQLHLLKPNNCWTTKATPMDDYRSAMRSRHLAYHSDSRAVRHCISEE